MGSGIASRWPVLVSFSVAAADRDPDGRLTDAAVERLFARARTAYFERCATVDEATLEIQTTTVQPGRAVVGDGVTASTNVIEVFSSGFTMAARLRPDDRDGIAATATCTLSPGGEVPKAMRDEFIALAHSAKYIH